MERLNTGLLVYKDDDCVFKVVTVVIVYKMFSNILCSYIPRNRQRKERIHTTPTHLSEGKFAQSVDLRTPPTLSLRRTELSYSLSQTAHLQH